MACTRGVVACVLAPMAGVGGGCAGSIAAAESATVLPAGEAALEPLAAMQVEFGTAGCEGLVQPGLGAGGGHAEASGGVSIGGSSLAVGVSGGLAEAEGRTGAEADMCGPDGAATAPELAGGASEPPPGQQGVGSEESRAADSGGGSAREDGAAATGRRRRNGAACAQSNVLQA